MFKEILFLAVIFFINDEIFSSAWIPKAGKYKYYFTAHHTDHQTKQLKFQKYQYYQELQIMIDDLEQRKLNAPANSKLQKLATEKIKRLKQEQNLALSHQDRYFYFTTIEYGVNDFSSLGIDLLYKLNSVNETKNITRSIDSFYKIQLLKTDDFALAIASKLYLTYDSNSYKELFSELSLFISKKTNQTKSSLIVDTGFSYCKGINKLTRKKRYYAFSIGETLKLPYGILLSNFSKYYLRKNYGKAYEHTLYEQISIGKEIELGIKNSNTISVRFGYFWDQSLKYKHCKASGFLISTWFEL